MQGFSDTESQRNNTIDQQQIPTQFEIEKKYFRADFDTSFILLIVIAVFSSCIMGKVFVNY